jgi:hypothetical protein
MIGTVTEGNGSTSGGTASTGIDITTGIETSIAHPGLAASFACAILQSALNCIQSHLG